MASKSGGLNIRECLQPRNEYRTEAAVRILRKPILSERGEGRCFVGRNGYMHHEDSTGVGSQASTEGSAEITSGKANSQQGLVATCKDLMFKVKPEALGGFWFGA